MIVEIDTHNILQLINNGEFIFFKWKNRPNWPVEFVSENTKTILGYDSEDFKKNTISYSQIIMPQDLSRVEEEVAKYSNLGVDRFSHKPYRVIKKNGEIIWVYDSTQIIRDKNNNIIYYIGYIVDITQIKQKEINLEKKASNLQKEIKKHINTIVENKRKLQKLNKQLKADVKEQKSLYEELFNNTKDGIILFYKNEILEYNQSILSLTKTDNKVELKQCIEVSFNKDKKNSLNVFFKKASQNSIYRFEYRIKTKTQKYIWCEITLMPLKLQNKNIMHSHWRDITIRKELEQKDKARTKQFIQQSRFAQMGEMISMIAHQWRQPLSVIGATISAMQTKIEFDHFINDNKELDNDSKYFLEHFNKINNNIQYMSQTIDDFRNFFQPNKHATSFYLMDAITSALTIMQQSLIEKNIKLSIENSVHRNIFSYKNEIIQVILNIIKNSEDALVEDRIKYPKISISIKESETKQILTIKDNAKGIKIKDIDKIFDPYFSTKSKNGTGLGLYMSKIIIHDHCNGKIKVKSNKSGTSFLITLPNTL